MVGMCLCVCERQRVRGGDKNVTEHHQSHIVLAAELFDNRHRFCTSCTKFIILATLAELTAYDVTVAEILVFLAITVEMCHCIWDKLTDCWANN